MSDFFPRGRMQNYKLFRTSCEEPIQRFSPDLELVKTETMVRASSTALKSAMLVNFPNKWYRLDMSEKRKPASYLAHGRWRDDARSCTAIPGSRTVRLRVRRSLRTARDLQLSNVIGQGCPLHPQPGRCTVGAPHDPAGFAERAEDMVTLRLFKGAQPGALNDRFSQFGKRNPEDPPGR